MEQTGHFKQCINSFEQQLRSVSVEAVSPEAYIKNYLSHLLQHAPYYLAIYADTLAKLLQHSPKKIEDMVLVDFGAGNGLLGIFAKYCGFRKVLINDIDSKFITAAQQLAMQLDVAVDGFAGGDISQLRLLTAYEIPDAVAGTDVIEHIYSLPVFFSILHELNPAIVTVFTTAANPANYFKVRSLKKLQVKDELYGADFGDEPVLGRSSPAAFLKIREEIIRRHIDASDEVIIELAKRTRGLDEAGIIAAVLQYQQHDQYPPEPDHPTNTCDPLNGSWTERILSFEAYRTINRNAGFTTVFYKGFFNETGSWMKKLLNRLIPVAGNFLAPYITIVGIGQSPAE